MVQVEGSIGRLEGIEKSDLERLMAIFKAFLTIKITYNCIHVPLGNTRMDVSLAFFRISHYLDTSRPRETHLMEKQCLFSTLSEDELLAIVSWDELEPYRPLSYWKEGPFSRAVPLLFRNIRLEGRRLRCMNKEWNQVAVDLITDFTQLGGCGQVFDLLNVNAEYRHDYSEQEVMDLESFFMDGSTLSIFFPAAAIKHSIPSLLLLLRIMGRRFEALEIYWSVINAVDISNNALDLITGCWKGLKRFKFSGRDPMQLSMIWKHIGGSLLELEVRLPTSIRGKWLNLLSTVRENCPFLTTIQLNNPFDDPDVGEDDYVLFLTAYKAQLAKAEVHGLGEDNLRVVSEACKNLGCTLHEDRNRFGRILALGNRIRKLKIDLLWVEDWKPIMDAMRECSAIEELILSSVSGNGMEMWVDNIFTPSAKSLKYLSIHALTCADDIKTIASSTGKLERISLRRVQKIVPECLEYLLHRNERLELLYMREVNDENSASSDTLQIIAHIIDAVRNYGHLQKIRISFPTRKMPPEKTMRDACTPFRIRRRVKFHFSFVDKAFEELKLYDNTR